GASYWYRSLREPVRFHEAATALLAEGIDLFVEVSPHPVLVPAIEEAADAHGGEAVAAIGSLRREEDGARRFVRSLAEAFAAGAAVSWETLLEAPAEGRIELPTYPFERRRFWLASGAGGAGDMAAAGQASSDHPLLGAAVTLAGGELLFTGRVSTDTQPWLRDHVAFDSVLLPGTAFVDLALTAGRECGLDRVEELTLEAPLVLEEGAAVQIQVLVGVAETEGRRTVEIHSRRERDSAPWTRHANGALAAAREAAPIEPEPVWPPPGAEPVEVGDFYAALGEIGLGYGPSFRGVRAAWRRGEELFAEVALDEEASGQAGSFAIHPALLDSAFHTALALSQRSPDGESVTVPLPFAWSDVRLFEPGAPTLRAHLLSDASGSSLRAFDLAGNPVIEVGRVAVRAAERRQLEAAAGDSGDRDLFRVGWVPLTARDAAEDAVDAVAIGGIADRVPELPGFADLDRFLAADGEGDARASVALVGLPLESEEAEEEDGGERATGQLLAFLRRWLEEPALFSVRLALVSAGAVDTGGGEAPDPVLAAQWGLVRSAQSEHPGRLLLVDLDGAEESRARLLETVASAGVETQVALREGRSLVPRLRRLAGDPGLLALPAAPSWHLGIERPGTLESLALLPDSAAEAPLQPGQVRIEVRAVGLNFRDVLIALDMYPGRAPVGGECAGVVAELGEEVEGLAVGDRVMGLISDGCGPVGIADARMLCRFPDGWSFAQAASVPVTFLTAYRGLVDLAGLRQGERLLVHAAAGGVGMAATQIARHLGAEVWATASPRKWEAVRDGGVAEERIASSRTLEFRGRFLERSGGEGMDVVLNSLAREFVHASLELLPRGGRFLEMGKTDIRDAAEVASAHPGVEYEAFDLLDAGPERIEEMLAELGELFERGVLEPLPTEAWDVRRAPEAFRYLSRGANVGKVVLTLPRAADPAGTALITGGTGVLGRLLGLHLAREQRYGRLLLVSRQGADAAGAADLVAELAELDCEARVEACDVADRRAVEELIAAVPAEAPLTAVFHTAGVLADAVVESLDEERLRLVMTPKTSGARNLHECTAGLELSEFVMYSSIASAFGSPGQGNYAAANSYLEALARRREAQGLPAQAIGWGLWERGTGMTGELSDADRTRLGRLGVTTLSDDRGMRLFEAARRSGEAALVAAPLDTVAIGAAASDATLPPLLSGLVRAGAAAGSRQSAASLRARLAGLAPEEAEALVLGIVREQVAGVLGHDDGEAIDVEAPFKDLGFDSLGAVELRNRLSAETGLRLPSTLAFDQPNVSAVAGYLGSQLGGGDAAEPRSPIHGALDQLESMLAEVPAQGEDREEVEARLRALSRRMRAFLVEARNGDGENGATAAGEKDDDLGSLADEELFAMIDKESS
ncbi:MAG TPA: SDR family NAD(P)-dependent oxidoreductase, partial [Solirubrobacterales bacterium]|nr:SDR family NAD(P)-dependent oxidoreductase [Solirubrobacterales bacterium]